MTEKITATLQACTGKDMAYVRSTGLDGGRLQNLICAAIPIYNIFAAEEHWPVTPIPAFCTPTPTPAPTPAPAT